MTECAGCGTRVSARGGQAAAGSSGSEHCRAPPPRLSRPAPVPLPRTAVVCFLTSTCTALNLQTSETELKISITKHLDSHTQYIKLHFTCLVKRRSFAMYLYQCAVASGALHCFPPPPPPSQLLSPRRGDSPVQRRQGRGAVRRLQSASWSRRCDATLASTIRHRGEPDLIQPSTFSFISLKCCIC